MKIFAASTRLLYLDTVTFGVGVRDQNEKQLLSAPVDWSSSNPDVAVVSDDGLVTGVWPGEAVIRAQSGAHVDSVRLVVHTAGGAGPRCSTLTYLPMEQHGFQFLEVYAGSVSNTDGPTWTYYQGEMLFSSAGVVFGTSAEDVVVANTAFTRGAEVGRSGVCRVPGENGWHSVSLLQVGLLTDNPYNPIPGLSVVQEIFAFPSPADDDYVLMRFTFSNIGAESIQGLRFGILGDLDVFQAGSNIGSWNESLGTAEVVYADSLAHPTVAGFRLVGIDTESYRTTFPLNPAGRRAPADFFSYLSGPDGTDRTTVQDVYQLLSAEAFDLQIGQSRSIWVPIVGGLTRAGYETHMARAVAAADLIEVNALQER